MSAGKAISCYFPRLFHTSGTLHPRGTSKMSHQPFTCMFQIEHLPCLAEWDIYHTSLATAPHPQELHWITHTQSSHCHQIASTGVWFPPGNLKFQQMGACKQKTLQTPGPWTWASHKAAEGPRLQGIPVVWRAETWAPWTRSRILFFAGEPAAGQWAAGLHEHLCRSLPISHFWVITHRSASAFVLSQLFLVHFLPHLVVNVPDLGLQIPFNCAQEDTRPWWWLSGRELAAPQWRGHPMPRCMGSTEANQEVEESGGKCGQRGLYCGFYGGKWVSKCK